MGGVVGKACTAIVIASTAVCMQKMAKRYYCTNEEKIVAWKPVGRVTELAIFPLWQGKKVTLPKAYCTPEGLRSTMNENLQDGCFVIYESGNKKLLPEANYYFDTIRVDCTLDTFVLEAPSLESLYIPFDKLIVGFTMITVHKGEVIPVRDCGEDAAKWVTKVFPDSNNKLRLGYYNMDFGKNPILTESHLKFLKSIKLFTRNGLIFHSGLTNPLLINEDSIAGVATAMETFLNPYDFNANIVFRYTTGKPLEEYTWKKVRIGDVEFDCIKSCENCLINRSSLYGKNTIDFDLHKLMLVMQNALQKYVNFKIKDTPYIGINLKLSGKEGEIKHNAEVFALC